MYVATLTPFLPMKPWLLSLLLCGIASAAPLYIYSGDGPTVVVLAANEDEDELSGEIRLGNAVHPFTATVREAGDAEIVDGSFTADQVPRKFRATLREDAETVNLVMDGKTYRLAEVNAIPGSVPAPAAVGDPGSVRLKRISFNDINMGGVLAYTMLVPHDWTQEGHIEWSPADNPYPQSRIKVTGPNNEKVGSTPPLYFSYAETVNGSQAPLGTPPPQDVGQWLVGAVRQSNKDVSEVRLISSRRNLPREEQQRKSMTDAGAKIAAGTVMESRVITIAYVEKGIPMREEINLVYQAIPMNTQYVRGASWNIFFEVIVAAPEKSFDRLRPQLYAYADSFTPVPQWWNQMMQARQEIINTRADRINEQIRRRGQMYSEMSDRQHAAYMSKMKQDDEAQRQRIQGIYEVQDYRDADGSRVELPFHYKHVFSDGQGNYVLSNTNEKPGGNFQEIEAAR